MRQEYIGRRKGEMEWGKLSLMKEIRKIFFNGGEKGGGERGKNEAYFLHIWLKEGITCSLNLV